MSPTTMRVPVGWGGVATRVADRPGGRQRHRPPPMTPLPLGWCVGKTPHAVKPSSDGLLEPRSANPFQSPENPQK
jgi:hypothetical protein